MWGHKGKGRLKTKKKSVVNKNGVRPFILSGINLMVSKSVVNKILKKPKSAISVSVINRWIGVPVCPVHHPLLSVSPSTESFYPGLFPTLYCLT